MTERQRKYWMERMRSKELSAVNYYRKRADELPDGSFMMAAFDDGPACEGGGEFSKRL